MTAVPTAGEEREGPVSFVYDIASHADSSYDSASVLIQIENQSSFAGRRSPFAYFATFLAAEGAAGKTIGKTIGLGLDADLYNLQGSRAVIYKEAGWQRAGLTTCGRLRLARSQ